MELTKHAHACVALTKAGRTLVIDPGVFTPGAREAVAGADAVLVTHEHFDHLDEELLRSAAVPVVGPPGVREKVGERVTAAAPGDRLEIAGFDVRVVGGEHAEIHAGIPRIENLGYVIDGAVYHPGDAYFVPGVPIGTLLLPSSGPWTRFGEAADFVRAVGPERVVQIHELMLSELGQKSFATLVEGLAGVPVEVLPPGSSVTL
ncbi:MBL fold metallo-hydrolase [Actinoplanes sp. CA-030573]|uniref:MBL fold metallo-hydrolase n=1 Tax=Actinoplanes sp. CA-030573 TaxID=3239898 RepID=UPI003D90057E